VWVGGGFGGGVCGGGVGEGEAVQLVASTLIIKY